MGGVRESHLGWLRAVCFARAPRPTILIAHQRQGETILDIGQLHEHMQALDKGDGASRREAIHFLKGQEQIEWASAPLEVIHSLVESVQNQLVVGMKQPLNCQGIVTLLGNIGPRSEPAIPQLIELLREGNPDGLREAAATALGKIGQKASVAVDQLIEVLSRCRPSLAIQAVRALGAIGCADQRVRAALLNLWLSPIQSPSRQVQVATALCRLKIDAKDLLRFLTSTVVANQDSALRKAAAEALAWCGKNELDVVPALLTAAVHDKDEKVRQTAEESLTQLRLSRPKAVQLCSKQLAESCYAETALRNCGAAAVPALIEALESEESAAREKAARTLGCLGEVAVEAVPALTRALRAREPDFRLAAAKGLWNITKNAEPIVPVLIGLLKDDGGSILAASEERRRFLQTVMEALRRIGPPARAAVPALKEKARDKNRHVSESAHSALKEIAPT